MRMKLDKYWQKRCRCNWRLCRMQFQLIRDWPIHTNEGADPYIGEVGKGEEVEEEKIEVIVPGRIRNKVLKAMLAAHPYEEPAYDIFVLDQQTNEYGLDDWETWRKK